MALFRSLLISLIVVCIKTSTAGTLTSPYIDTTYFTSVPFGSYSHYIQPWRSYLETVPAHKMLKGIGLCLPTGSPQPDLLLQMLSQCGIRTGRIEIGWGNLDYVNEKITNANLLQTLQACKKWGIRPTILLNGHQGGPCPFQYFEKTLLSGVDSGSSQITLTDTIGIVLNKSGVCHISGYWAAEGLVSAINGNVITISKPLRKAYASGSKIEFARLKYRPFSVPGSTDYNETMAGWKKYVETVSQFVMSALGTTSATNKGFDLEIWNELSFGSDFLYINKYYSTEPYSYEETSIWNNLVDTTAALVAANVSMYQGVRLVNGFSNTIPWTASSALPARVGALSKHPYAGAKSYPQNSGPASQTMLNALFTSETFIPSYQACFPEYFGCAIQTETMVRDMGPITTSLYGTNHGRYARPGNPCPVWMTEVGIAPNEIGITDTARGLAIKAKSTLRYYAFFLNKGVENLEIFGATEHDMWLGIVLDKFVNYLQTSQIYPADDAPYISPSLRAVRSMVSQFTPGLDTSLTLEKTRALSVVSIADQHDHFQFEGNATPGNPKLYNREVLAILPFQINAHRLVIGAYVMTRDIRNDLAPESYSIKIRGIHATNAQVSAHDPITGSVVPVSVSERTDSLLTISVDLTDYPRFITVEEEPLQNVNPVVSSRLAPSAGSFTTFATGFGRAPIIDTRATRISAYSCRGQLLWRKELLRGNRFTFPVNAPGATVYRIEYGDIRP